MADDLARQCATTVMDTFHTMMRTVGSEARKRSSTDLSMQQFRAMKTIQLHEGASLSILSEHLGATLSASSKLIDGLVERGYVRRQNAEDDRRRLILALTDPGQQALGTVHMELIACLTEKLTGLTAGECGIMNLAMDVLRSALVATQPPPTGQSKQRSEQLI
jgi:DNA-binding MarR family transcriptional regulator